MGLSAALTLGLAIFGVVFGLAVGSQAIVFDGVFELIDAGMSALAMATASPVDREGNRRLTPEALHSRVRAAVDPVISRHGLLGYNSYAAKTGRLNRIEIHIVVPANWCHRIETHDAIRREIAAGLVPEARLDAWLSISFTAEPAWT